MNFKFHERDKPSVIIAFREKQTVVYIITVELRGVTHFFISLQLFDNRLFEIYYVIYPLLQTQFTIFQLILIFIYYFFYMLLLALETRVIISPSISPLFPFSVLNRNVCFQFNNLSQSSKKMWTYSRIRCNIICYISVCN